MPQPPAPASARTRSSRRSARAGWARSTGRATRASIARSRSRSSPRTWPPTPSSPALRARGEERSPPSTIPTSAPSTTSVTQDGDRLPGHGVPRGRDARRAAGEGPLPLDQVLRYGIEIAEALDRAHRAGHRAPRPQARQRHAHEAGAKLLDFGLAKLRAGPARRRSRLQTAAEPLTAAGHASSARSQYMAPEQLEGKEPTRAPTSSRSAPCSTRW